MSQNKRRSSEKEEEDREDKKSKVGRHEKQHHDDRVDEEVEGGDGGEGEEELGEEEGMNGSGLNGSGGGREVIVIIDLASLETVKTKKGDFQLLNCDDHIALMKKLNRDPQLSRPDIAHQEIMAVLDSPLNKAGKVKLYVHTLKNVLIEINPKTRLPRTFKRFSGLMVQLLHRLKIRSADGKDTLLKVVKNPISRHLPAGARVYGFSQHGELYNPNHFATTLPDDVPTVLIFGAMAMGSVVKEDHPYMQNMVSISEYPLSGVVAINRVMGAIENHWGIN